MVHARGAVVGERAAFDAGDVASRWPRRGGRTGAAQGSTTMVGQGTAGGGWVVGALDLLAYPAGERQGIAYLPGRAGGTSDLGAAAVRDAATATIAGNRLASGALIALALESGAAGLAAGIAVTAGIGHEATGVATATQIGLQNAGLLVDAADQPLRADTTVKDAAT